MRAQDYDLVRVVWHDAHNNQGAWIYGEDELKEFAEDNRFQVDQVGWLVHEDKDCIVLAARVAEDAYGQVERIPVRMIDTRVVINLG